MRDEPNSRDGRYGPNPIASDDLLPPELEAIARRFSADGSLWLSQLPDPVRVADRIRAIPATHPRTLGESEHTMSTQVNVPPERGAGAPRPNGRPPRIGPKRGLLAALAAAVIVALLAFVFVALAQRGTTTGPVRQPTPTQTQPAPTSTATQPAPTATATIQQTGTWTTIQGYTAGGNFTTPSLDVTSPWRLVWQCNRNTGNPGPYTIHVSASPTSDPGTNPNVLDVVCQAGNTTGTSAEQTTPTGSISLSVTAPGGSEWDLRVQVLR